MLEKLALEYSLFGTYAVILVFILLMVGLLLAFVIAISDKWEELEYSSKYSSKWFKTSIKAVTVVTVLVGITILDMMLFSGIKIKFTELSTYYNIHNNPTNVTEYYKIEQKVDLLDLKLKDKYRDLGVLQEREIVKLVKEDSNLYLIEYEGQYFEIEKEKK